MAAQSDHRPTLLFVDDEPDIVDIARTCFEMANWTVVTADNVAAAQEHFRNTPVDAVLSDIMMRGGSGIDFLEWVRGLRGRSFVFYLLTGCIDERITLALDRGADGVFNKPCNWGEVVRTLSRAVEQVGAGRQLKA